jgi:sigma-B regulation protein RsbU (phosphoserine phosphatase)
MKIRDKLTILLVSVTLVPLIVVTYFHHSSMHDLGDEVAEKTKNLLTRNEKAYLLKTVDDYSQIIQKQKRMMESAIRVQAREVEQCLARDPSTPGPVHFSQDFQPGKPLHPSMKLAYKHIRETEKAGIPPVQVNYRHQLFILPENRSRQDLDADLSRLSSLVKGYRFAYLLQPDMIYWQHTILESGLQSRYPAHDHPLEESDPLKQPWYTQARERGHLTWLVATEAATQAFTQVVAMPVHRPDGSFAGVTAIYIPFSSTFQALDIPTLWAEYVQSMLVLFQPGGQTSSDRLKVLAYDLTNGSANQFFDKRSNGENLYLCSEGCENFKEMIRSIASGSSGVQRVNYKGEDQIFAYGSHDENEPFPLLALPYRHIEEQAVTLQEHVRTWTNEYLQMTGYVVLGAVLFSLFVALGWTRTLTRPIMGLASAAQALARGNFQARVKIRTGDELQELGDIFNDMGPKLQENERMRHAMEVAKKTQQYLLPEKAPRVESYDISGVSIASDETGGDYYDFIEFLDVTTDKMGIAIGDVSGHGIGAALLMASARGVIRSQASRYSGELSDLFSLLNHHLLRDTRENQFLTLFYGILDPQTHSLFWCSAGHEPGIRLRRSTGQIEELPNTGMPLGISEEASYESGGPITLERGDLVLISTDGIRETHNPNREMFGWERLHRLLLDNAHQSTKHICDTIVQALQDFRQGTSQEDDVTMVVIKYQTDEEV